MGYIHYDVFWEGETTMWPTYGLQVNKWLESFELVKEMLSRTLDIDH